LNFFIAKGRVKINKLAEIPRKMNIWAITGIGKKERNIITRAAMANQTVVRPNVKTSIMAKRTVRTTQIHRIEIKPKSNSIILI
jgi:hypothetical protein